MSTFQKYAIIFLSTVDYKYKTKSQAVLISALLVCLFRSVNSLLNEQIQILSHEILHILIHHFADIRSISITFPDLCLDSKSRSLRTLEELYNEHLVKEIISSVGNFTAVNIQSASDDSDLPEDGILEQGYLILFFQCSHTKDNSYKNIAVDIKDIFENQLLYQIKDKLAWNARAKFLVITLPFAEEQSKTVAFRLSQSLWDYAGVSNFLIIIPEAIQELDQCEGTSKVAIYSWFPYSNSSCGQVEDVILLDQWVYNNGTCSISEKFNFFSYNLPRNFQSCPLRISALGPEPYVVNNRNYTDKHGNTVHDVEGVGVNLIHSFGQKYNFALTFLPPVQSLELDNLLLKFSDIYTNESDVLTGCIPLMHFFYAQGDVTFPVFFESAVWVVPCPAQLSRMERIVRIFTLPSWLAIGSVMYIGTAVLCLQAHYYKGELKRFKDCISCFLDVWAVLLSVSVSKLPKTENTRRLFIMLIWYSFVISMMFQTFFITYLVEPGYETQFKTLDDLRESMLPYGFIQFFEFMLSQTSYKGHNTLRSSKIECVDIYECTEKVIFERNMVTLTMQLMSYYIAENKGVRDLNNVVCFLDETLFSGGLVMSVRKGNPLLGILNDHLSRSIEGGLQDKYWSELKYKIRLQNQTLDDKLYFVFSFAHLSPVFMMLACGYFISIFALSVEIIYTYYVKMKQKAIQNCPYKSKRLKYT
ncbi:Ionotropic receptor 615 [Blattella germanica]|nr:Ionotropic receptor 615 [Blattella germanica]